MRESITFFRVLIINIPANTEVKMLNIGEGTRIQRIIRDMNIVGLE